MLRLRVGGASGGPPTGPASQAEKRGLFGLPAQEEIDVAPGHRVWSEEAIRGLIDLWCRNGRHEKSVPTSEIDAFIKRYPQIDGGAFDHARVREGLRNQDNIVAGKTSRIGSQLHRDLWKRHGCRGPSRP